MSQGRGTALCPDRRPVGRQHPPRPRAPGGEAGDAVVRRPTGPSPCGPANSPWSQTRSSPQRPRLQMWVWRWESQGLLHGHWGPTCQAATDPGSWQELFLALWRIGAFGASCWALPPSTLQAEVSGSVPLCQLERPDLSSPSPNVRGRPNAMPSLFPPGALTGALCSSSKPRGQVARRPPGRKALGTGQDVNADKKQNGDA